MQLTPLQDGDESQPLVGSPSVKSHWSCTLYHTDTRRCKLWRHHKVFNVAIPPRGCLPLVESHQCHMDDTRYELYIQIYDCKLLFISTILCSMFGFLLHDFIFEVHCRKISCWPTILIPSKLWKARIRLLYWYRSDMWVKWWNDILLTAA